MLFSSFHAVTVYIGLWCILAGEGGGRMVTSVSAGGIVVNERGEILLVGEKGGFWTFPKGHLRPDEEPYEAAVREIQEETGLSTLKFSKALGSYERSRLLPVGSVDLPEVKTIHMFLFHSTNDVIAVQSDENPVVAWFTFESALEKLSHQEDRRQLANWAADGLFSYQARRLDGHNFEC
jgi:8-oxo-dGTP pyrophosphatase MutT (NUDIX family)